jgi:hypothetical protein
MRHFTNLAGTQLAADAPRGPTLPFAPAAPAPLPAPPKPESLVPEGMRRFTSLTGTQGVVDAPSSPSLPFAKSPAPIPTPSPEVAEPPMALEQYARLHVEIARDPKSRREIVQRYGIDEQRLSRLDAYWGPRIVADARLRAVWDSTYAAHRARLGRPEGPPR